MNFPALLAPFLGDAILTDAQLSQLDAYLDLLLRWNARINLTAVRNPAQIATRHFGESLFAARHVYSQPATGHSQLVDIGSGAGFPGLPIKIWAPALHLTLLESNQRKATFLREVVRALQLTGVQVLATRAETYAEQINKNSDKKKSDQEDSDKQLSNNKMLNYVGPGAPAGAALEAEKIVAAAGAPPAADLTITLRAVEHFDAILPTAIRLLENYPAPHRRLALLIGASQIPTAHAIAQRLTWSDPLPIPGSTSRVILIGRQPA